MGSQFDWQPAVSEQLRLYGTRTKLCISTLLLLLSMAQEMKMRRQCIQGSDGQNGDTRIPV